MSFNNAMAENARNDMERWSMKVSAKVLTCAFALAAFPALSQEVPNRAPNFYAGERALGTVKVQTTMSLSVPVEVGQEIGEQIKAAQKGLYTMASEQCDLILQALAESCQITNLTSSVDLNRGGRNEILVNAAVTMAVKVKDAAKGP